MNATHFDIPPEIAAACLTVSNWMGKRESSDWQIGDVASRKSLLVAIKERDALLASHCALVAALEEASDLFSLVAHNLSLKGEPDLAEWTHNGTKMTRKALSDARNLSAGMERGTR